MPTSIVGGPIPTHARQGRQKQKYGEHGERLLAGCIPFRVKTDSFDEEDDGESIEVLLVTRRSGQGWVIPKGGWESDDDDVEHAARRETVEEAGVRGKIEAPILGIFQFQSNKKANGTSDTNCRVHVFAMLVLEQLEFWPEATVRKRDWFPINQALQLCTCDWMRNAISVLIKRKHRSFTNTSPTDISSSAIN